jgi:hypothetical protein
MPELEALLQVYALVSYLPNELAFKVAFGKINQNDMAHVLVALEKEMKS